MAYADRLQRWNRWYEETPEQWRFQIIVWALVFVGAVNMLMTITVGFPFGLLLVVAIAAIAAVRAPHALGWVKTGQDASAAGSAARMEIEAPAWVINVNRWYEGLPENIRPFVLLVALAVPGAINMALTMFGGFPFGLLFLLAVLAVIAIRAPYAAGWVKGQPAAASYPSLAPASPTPRIASENTPPPLADAPKREGARAATAGARSARGAAGKGDGPGTRAPPPAAP